MHKEFPEPPPVDHAVEVPCGDLTLEGELRAPSRVAGLVVFASASGSRERDERDRILASHLHRTGVGTLVLNLPTVDEAAGDARSRTDTIATRLVAAVRWADEHDETRFLRKGLFGEDEFAGAALLAAAELGEAIAAIVSRDGRSVAAAAALSHVTAPTLLLAGAPDEWTIAPNRESLGLMRCRRELVVLREVGRWMGEREAVEEAARLAAYWFLYFFARPES